MGATHIPIITETGTTKITMSNKGAGFYHRGSGRFIVLILAIAVFSLSAQMAYFGSKHVKIDLTEVDQSERKENETLKFARDCQDWQFQFGYRLICRKMIAHRFFRNQFSDISDPNAKLLLENVLSISPLEPAYYVLRARVGLYTFEPNEKLIALLRLSYLSGRSEQTLMYQRFQIALTLWGKLEKADKSIVINDYLRNFAVERAVMDDMIISSPESVFTEIVDIIRYRNPDASERLVQLKSAKSGSAY